MSKILIVGLKDAYFIDHKLNRSFDKEILDNRNEKHPNKKKRPVVAILLLKYKGKKQGFAIPFRSNIPSGCPDTDCFVLPVRKTTKQGKKHGLHLVKMLPVDKRFFEKYILEISDMKSKEYIEANKETLIRAAQSYLDRFEQGERPLDSVDIDKVYNAVYGQQ